MLLKTRITTNKYFLVILLLIGITLLGYSYYFYTTHHKRTNKSNELSYQTFFDKTLGWGYDIKLNNRIIIHQDIVPAVATKSGFKSEQQAKQVAELVIKKLLRNEIPPTVTEEDLKQIDTKGNEK